MQKSHKALWDNCLHLIRQNVTEQTFKTWFEPIVFESHNEEQKTVLVQVPSPYVYEYLEQYYVRLMAWALSNSFKTNVRLTYRLVTDKEHKLTQDVENGILNFEEVHCRMRGMCKDECIICKPQSLLSLADRMPYLSSSIILCGYMS